jgi:hypothetical protein
MKETKLLIHTGDMMRYYLAVLIIIVLVTGCGGDKPLADRIKAEGLELDGPRTLQQSELPPGASSGQQFVLPTHCGDCGGKILIFANDADAGKMAEAWRKMGQYVYVKEGVLLQVNGKVEESVADRYGEVLLK